MKRSFGSVSKSTQRGGRSSSSVSKPLVTERELRNTRRRMSEATSDHCIVENEDNDDGVVGQLTSDKTIHKVKKKHNKTANEKARKKSNKVVEVEGPPISGNSLKLRINEIMLERGWIGVLATIVLDYIGSFERLFVFTGGMIR